MSHATARRITWVIITLVLFVGAGAYFHLRTRAAVTVGSDAPSFQADLKNTLALQAGVGAPTFTRASTATVTDFEGVLRYAKSGEARFEGARRVENLMTYSEDFDNAAWKATGWHDVTVTTNSVAAPDGTMTADKVQITAVGAALRQSLVSVNPAGKKFVFSMWMKSGTLSSIRMNPVGTGAGGCGGLVSISGISSSWKRYTILYDASYCTGTDYIRFIFQPGYPELASSGYLYLWGAQLEETTGQANQNPSEYVSTGVLSAPYHGAGVDGVKYFTTQNGNTVSNNVVTEATGSAIPDETLHGYLAEGARTNLVTYSEMFDNASWWTSLLLQAFGSGSIANAVPSPSGSTTADKIVETTALGYHQIYQNSTVTAGVTAVFSLYAKAGERSQIRVSDDSGAAISIFDVSNGTVVSGANASIYSVGNGWYRCVHVFTPSTTSGRVYIALSVNGNGSYTGDGTSGIYLWGAQLEQAPFASSYIPTTSATVTRAADALTYPTAGNAANTAGTMYSESRIIAGIPSGAIGIMTVGDGTQNNFIGLRYDIGGYDMSATGFTGGVNQTAIFRSISALNISVKSAHVYATNRRNAYFNGGAVSNPQSSYTPIASGSFTNIEIGMLSGSNQLFGTIRNVKIWKKALTDTQLTNMTSTDSAVSRSAVNKTTVKATGVTKMNVSQNGKLTDGLVGLWSFNGPDMSGNTAFDRSGQGNNGTLTSGPAPTQGRVGQALSFDGVNDYVNIPTVTGWSPLGSSFSLSAWIKDTGDRTGDVIFDASAGRVSMEVHSSNLGCLTNNDAWKFGGTISANVWMHVVCVFDGTNMNGYIDGARVFSVADNAPSANPTTMTISGETSRHDFLFNGSIDEVRIYNRALSATEVAQLYNMGR